MDEIRDDVVEPADTASALCMRGVEYYNLNDIESAEDNFLAAIRLDPTIATGYYNLSVVYSLKNWTDKAADAYKVGYVLNPDYKTALTLQVVPNYIQIETIRACNAACIMCPIETSPTPNRVMSSEIFERILAEIATIPQIETVAVHGLGEPLMDKKIAARIRRLKEIGIPRVPFVSNATLMTPQIAEEILDAGIDVGIFSIESVEQKTYEKIRKNLKLSDAISGIEAFLAARAQ